MQTGIVDVAWVKTIGYYFNPYRTGCLITTGDQKSRRNPGQMAPKSSPDPTSPPWVSVCPYSATKQMQNPEIQKEAGNLVLLGKTGESGDGGEGPCERGRNGSPSLTGWETRAPAGSSWSMSCCKSRVIQNDCSSQAAEKTLKEVKPFKQKDVHLKIWFQPNTY